MKIKQLIFLLFPLYLPAQELSGIWTGYLQTKDSQLPYELAINDDEKKITGYSQTIYLIDGIENIGIKTIKVTPRKKDFLLEDGKLVFDNYTVRSTRSKLIGALLLTITDSQMTLQGTFRTRSLDMRVKTSYEGKIFLQKKNKQEPTKLTAKLDELKLLNTLPFISEMNAASAALKTGSNTIIAAKDLPAATSKNNDKITVPDKNINVAEGINSRKIEILSSIYYKNDSLVLSLYDNGTVDGDTVSVYLNDKMIISKGRLSTEPIRVTVPVNTLQGDTLILVMYAENLGTIPPNTGLLIIQDGQDRYEIRFAGDLQKSSGIFLRKKL
jgi:hypothetical protein